MREVARWIAEAVGVVAGCGEPEAELLLQRGEKLWSLRLQA